MLNELVSIVVPCYNVGPFLGEALESVLAQTYTNWECIIVNDGSLDNTHDVAIEWEKKDSRFVYLKLQNGGVERARNKGIERANGEYILPLDGDDKLAPTFLEKTLQVFREQPDTMLVYSLVELFEAKAGLWHLKDFSLKNLAAENMIVCTALYRKKEWIRTGGYDEQVKYHLEDWELWINMLKDGGKVLRINEPLFFYRIRPLSGVRSQTPEKMAYMRKYITAKHHDFFSEHLGDMISLYWEKENYKNLIHKYEETIHELSLPNRLKNFLRNPLKAIANKSKKLIMRNKSNHSHMNHEM
jgi:glycosyltransferase involved in cell wall biosynthesis